MTTIIVVFFIAFIASYLLTPLVRRFGNRFSLVDNPSERKIHATPIPRVGGIALFIAFLLPLVFLPFNEFLFREMIDSEPSIPLVAIGLTAIFLLGLWDDFRQLPVWLKFVGQVACAVFSYYAGIKIHIVSFPFTDGIVLGDFSLPVTVFWFVLVINAINLIDGLDGLAAGVSLFVSTTMLVICLTTGKLFEAAAFASLAGCLIGFLRYNFYPATIFMGDSGSYFLGYLLASLGIMGSIKGQVATAMLIPVIALGVPLVDTLWAPIRRFALGKKMFQADQGHLHHCLIKLGYTQKRVVLTIYGLTIILGAVSVYLVHANDETAALILMVFGAGIIFVGRYFGIAGYFDTMRLRNWFKDISDESGLSQKRRNFLNYQVAISQSHDIDQFWEEVCDALQHLEFDHAHLIFNRDFFKIVKSDRSIRLPGEQIKTDDLAMGGNKSLLTWNREKQNGNSVMRLEGMLKVEQPLYSSGDKFHNFGVLYLEKEISRNEPDPYSLKRIELLRRVMSSTLENMYNLDS